MKKWVFIGIILLFGVVCVYLIFYKTSEETRDVFTDLGLNNPPIIDAPTNTELNPVAHEPESFAPEKLQQLTVRPAVGAVLFSREGGTLVRYVEGGTGHVYEINPHSGAEVLVSETTFVRITKAVFSFDGNQVALVGEKPDTKTVFVGAITDARALVGEYLPPGSSNLVFNKDATAIRFTLSNQDGTRGYQENLTAKTRSLLFNIPLISVGVSWENDDDYLITTKPSKYLAGFMYEIEKNNLKRLLGGVFGLTTLASDSWVAYGGQEAGKLTGDVFNRKSGVINSLPIYILPEKCDFNPADRNDLWCAWPSTDPEAIYPDDWYQGTNSTDDILWQIDLTKQTATMQSDFKAVSGRKIDVSGLTRFGDYALFTNKLDGTLWLFNISS